MSRTHSDSWLVWGATARGATHIRSGLPNQDAIGFLPASDGSPRCAVVVSDGHGGKPHSLSNLGSRFAVESAMAELGDLLAADQADPCALNAIERKNLLERIHRNWIGRVTAHATAHAQEALEIEDMLLPYGCTLVAAAISENHVLLLQIGDGDILIGPATGMMEKPLSDDEGLFGEQTYSLCKLNACEAGRTASIKRDGSQFVMVSTDGLAKSFANDADFVGIGIRYRELIAKQGLSGVADGLGGWLSEVTAQGSGDDISLGFMVGPSLVRSKKPEAASTKPNKAQGGVAYCMAWMLAGVVLTMAVALVNPWRPWALLPQMVAVEMSEPEPSVETLPPVIPAEPIPQPQASEGQSND